MAEELKMKLKKNKNFNDLYEEMRNVFEVRYNGKKPEVDESPLTEEEIRLEKAIQSARNICEGGKQDARNIFSVLGYRFNSGTEGKPIFIVPLTNRNGHNYPLEKVSYFRRVGDCDQGYNLTMLKTGNHMSFGQPETYREATKEEVEKLLAKIRIVVEDFETVVNFNYTY